MGSNYSVGGSLHNDLREGGGCRMVGAAWFVLTVLMHSVLQQDCATEVGK